MYIGSYGSGNGQFYHPAIQGDVIIITDNNNNRAQKLTNSW